ncbi:MAG: hypothetical protein AUJ85_08150 [Elusimicrobia bacterium CG1_02_37_114]|nr:MAG: hypothetical protein AUJ85_08150 [Elusimicrobia bacterium CG1_02_37_114]PIV52324.1 MAG: hypothetical protein COS17_09700 [Elusimicrobia bacterium CG02_land_8_20_14_3_00_37_13]PIZ12573.1 MAG: hypothetical protein COY53_09250 [Elusimicrobia bacterium CG_4_10_14_0_8_um_filter_37_32]
MISGRCPYFYSYFYFLLIIFIVVVGCNEEEKYKFLEMDKNKIGFIDGDTFFYGNTSIRLLGVDTPEIISKEYGIYENQEMGPEAADFTRKEILKANLIQYIPYEKDEYGRLLAQVFVDGELLAVKLIKAGLAYETVSFYGDNGFKEFGRQILKTSKKSPTPKFENPYLWKKQHRKSITN